MSRLIDEYGASLPPACSLICADYAPAMVNQVAKTAKAAVEQDPGSIWARVDARVLDALDLNSITDNSHSHVAAGLVSEHTLSYCLETAVLGTTLLTRRPHGFTSFTI